MKILKFTGLFLLLFVASQHLSFADPGETNPIGGVTGGTCQR